VWSSPHKARSIDDICFAFNEGPHKTIVLGRIVLEVRILNDYEITSRASSILVLSAPPCPYSVAAHMRGSADIPIAIGRGFRVSHPWNHRRRTLTLGPKELKNPMDHFSQSRPLVLYGHYDRYFHNSPGQNSRLQPGCPREAHKRFTSDHTTGVIPTSQSPNWPHCPCRCIGCSPSQASRGDSAIRMSVPVCDSPEQGLETAAQHRGTPIIQLLAHSGPAQPYRSERRNQCTEG